VDQTATYGVIKAQLQHVPVIGGLFNSYRVFHGRATDPDGARHFVEQRLANHESVIFLALSDGRGLGFTQLYPSFSSVSMQRIWIVNDLFVAPSERRQGIGEALLTRAYQFAEETGAQALRLATATDNVMAQSVFEKLGWQRDTAFYHYEISTKA
jgi:GNAT superfamily N-acetyltransferase